MQRNRLFFVSTRSYAQTACTIHSAQFAGGIASNVQAVDSICRHEASVVNFDVDIDASGTVLTFVDSHFGSNGQPKDAVLVMARWNGAQFRSQRRQRDRPRRSQRRPVRSSTRRRSRPTG